MYLLLALIPYSIASLLHAHKEGKLLQNVDKKNWEALEALIDHLAEKKEADKLATVRLKYLTGDIDLCKKAIIYNVGKLNFLKANIPEALGGKRYAQCLGTLMPFALSLQSMYRIAYTDKPPLVLPDSPDEILAIIQDLHLELFLCSSSLLDE